MSDGANTQALRAARDLLLASRTDLRAAQESFAWPTMTGTFCWATDWFDVIGRGNPAPALRIVEEDGSEQRLSYDDLVRRSDRLAGWLRGQGVVKGDRVLLMLGNQVELWESMLAVMKLGAVILPTTTALGTADLQERISRADVRYVIANGLDASKFDGLQGITGICTDGAPTGWLDYRQAREADDPGPFTAVTLPEDTLLLYFTSGTTSRPKLVAHSQVSYPVGHLSTLYWLGLQPGDVHMTIASPGWAKHAWSCFFAPFLAEASVAVYNYGRFDAASLLGSLRGSAVTSFCAPPTVWRMLIQAELGERPPALREVVAAGEPLNPEVISQIRSAWQLTVRDGFGQTETTAQIGNTPGQPVSPGAMGHPLPGIPVTLVDPVTGKPAAREGEICLDLSSRPLPLMSGYQGDAELASHAMAGGYYHTGDVGTRAEDGCITYIGRTDDVFKSSDYKISPFELESVLVEHPGVVEAAVVPAPDPLRLAVPKAFVTLAAGWDQTEETARSVLQHARTQLAPFLRVRRIEFVHELPKTISGKIRRVELRRLEQERYDAGASVGEWRDDELGLR